MAIPKTSRGFSEFEQGSAPTSALLDLENLQMAADDIDAFLFDLGQVVIGIDFNRAFSCWGRHASCDRNEIENRFSQDKAYEQFEVGEISASNYFESLRESLDIDITDDQFLEGWNEIFIGEMAGIKRLLTGLAAQLPIYAFTNSNSAHEVYWLEKFQDVLRSFRHVFNSSTIKLRKPDAEAFQYVARQTGVPLERIHFFDDVRKNIDAAQSCGMSTTHVTTDECVGNAVVKLGFSSPSS